MQKVWLITCAVLRAVWAQSVLDLSDIGWTVTNQARNITVPGKWPSQVHLDLYAAGVIGQ